MTHYTLRPYQNQLIDTVVEKFMEKKFVLAQAPTGAGKTIIFCHLIRRFLTEYPEMRICVLVHREILVRQNADKLRRVWPEAHIGIACASASKDVNVTAPVVFGSIQTIERRVGEIPPFHLVIVDEAHRLPPSTVESQYKRFISKMVEYYPDLRLFGLTATPYRLNHGHIYGMNCKRKKDESPNWFDALDYQLSILDLQTLHPDDANPGAPYLCPMRVFVEDRAIEVELSRVKTTAGEFNQAALSSVMRGGLHIKSAVDTYLKYREGRSRCCVFGVDIAHACDLVEAFKQAGIIAESVHSEMSDTDRKKHLSMFHEGALQVLVNVGVLTEGWDEPATDMLMLARPTLSAALFVQMVGRGLRIFPGKKDVLVLDLGGNFDRHGPPWSPILPKYQAGGIDKKAPVIQPDKACPECGHENPPRQWTCAECGAVLRVKETVEAQAPAMRELNLSAVVQQEVAKMAVPKEMKVISILARRYTSKAGNDTLKVDVSAKNEGALMPVQASHFFQTKGAGRMALNKWWKTFVADAVKKVNPLHAVRNGAPQETRVDKHGNISYVDYCESRLAVECLDDYFGHICEDKNPRVNHIVVKIPHPETLPLYRDPKSGYWKVAGW